MLARKYLLVESGKYKPTFSEETVDFMGRSCSEKGSGAIKGNAAKTTFNKNAIKYYEFRTIKNEN